MYNLPHHKENDPQVVLEFIHQHPFAFLTGCDKDNKPVATQVPLFIEETEGRKILRGHIMKQTDHHNAFLHNEHVLVVFSSRNTYVSATWYSNPHIGSTWNYMSVHITGTIRLLDDHALVEVLRKTTLHFEKYNAQSDTVFDNLPPAYTEKMMKAIVAFEIDIKKIDTVFKLSQDRDYTSYQQIREKLSQQDEDGRFIAAEMEKRTAQIFPAQTIRD